MILCVRLNPDQTAPPVRTICLVHVYINGEYHSHNVSFFFRNERFTVMVPMKTQNSIHKITSRIAYNVKIPIINMYLLEESETLWILISWLPSLPEAS